MTLSLLRAAHAFPVALRQACWSTVRSAYARVATQPITLRNGHQLRVFRRKRPSRCPLTRRPEHPAPRPARLRSPLRPRRPGSSWVGTTPGHHHLGTSHTAPEHSLWSNPLIPAPDTTETEFRTATRKPSAGCAIVGSQLAAAHLDDVRQLVVAEAQGRDRRCRIAGHGGSRGAKSMANYLWCLSSSTWRKRRPAGTRPVWLTDHDFDDLHRQDAAERHP